MKQNLDMDTIGKLDEGRVAVAVNNALAQIAHDLNRRPGVDKARKLTLTLTMKPQIDSDGLLGSVDIGKTIKATLPDTQGHITNAKVNASGELVWNDASPDDIKQSTLDEAREVGGSGAA